jgi:hypothetical protein
MPKDKKISIAVKIAQWSNATKWANLNLFSNQPVDVSSSPSPK